MSRIEQLITEIEEYIDGCKPQAFSNNKKIIVDKDEIEELLAELRLRTPDEIKKYQKIISNKDAILNSSQEEADAIVANAREQADRILAEAQKQSDAIMEEVKIRSAELVSENEVMQQAYIQANEVITMANAQSQQIVNDAAAEADGIRYGAIDYTDSLLASFQEVLKKTMADAEKSFQTFAAALKATDEVVSGNRNELKPPVASETSAAAAASEAPDAAALVEAPADGGLNADML